MLLLLPPQPQPRLVLDRNRGGAYLAVLVIGAAMFGIFLFLGSRYSRTSVAR